MIMAYKINDGASVDMVRQGASVEGDKFYFSGPQHIWIATLSSQYQGGPTVIIGHADDYKPD